MIVSRDAIVKIVTLLVPLGAVAAGGAGAFRTSDPLRAFVRGEYPRGDDYFIHGSKDTTLFRCVLVKARDGIDGVALSEVSIWGNHGGPWEAFEKRKGGFVYVGSRELPDTSCLESCRSSEYLASGRCRWKRGWPTRAERLVGALAEGDYPALPWECECEFYRGHVAGDTVVFATRGNRARGVAKIGGKVRALRLASKRHDPVCRAGHRFSERWSDGSTSVTLDAAVTTSGEEACWYEGRMIVTDGGRQETTPVTGSCGC